MTAGWLAAVIAAAPASSAMGQEPAGLAASALADTTFTWQRRTAPGFRVYFKSGSYAAQRQDSLLALLPPALEHARTLLRTRAPDGPIDLFFVESRDDMRQLTGAPVTGFAHRAARAVFLVTNPSWRAFERHEIMHVVSWFAWGRPADGTDWLQEGLAQAADGRCAGYSNEAVLRGLARTQGWFTLDDVLRNFRRLDDLRAYLQAAAFSAYLLETAGPDALASLWRNGATSETMVGDRTLAGAERQWRSRPAPGEPPTPGELAGISDKGCG